MALSVMCFFSLCCFRHTNIMDDTMISPPPITDVFELASRPLCPLSFVVCVVCFGWLFCVGVFLCVFCVFFSFGPWGQRRLIGLCIGPSPVQLLCPSS